MKVPKQNKIPFSTISVIGLGYIGLPTAAVLASRGVKVIGVDVTEQVINTINAGNIHIVEPDLDIVVRATVSTGNLKATLSPEPADAFIIAVPTPLKSGNVPDLSHIKAAAEAIAPVLQAGNLVILESTAPVGTTEKLAEWLAQYRQDLTFPQQAGEKATINIAYCPERVLPGHLLHELITNDRIIGGMTPVCAQRAMELYSIFLRGKCYLTNPRTAEMCKIAENSFRDVNIAYANELSLICDELEINVWEVRRLANLHPRVNILQPGPGVGGHCIAVDPWFIVHTNPNTARLIRQAREVNEYKPQAVIEKVKVAAKKYKTPAIACIGLSFKADIDDLRESPAVEIVQRLKQLNIGKLYVAEPYISSLPSNLIGENVIFSDTIKAIALADIVLLLVNHEIFKAIDVASLKDKEVIDTRGFWNTV